MAENSKLRSARFEDALAFADDTRVLILEAPYYKVVTDQLIDGANAVLSQHKSHGDRFQVPGALELPQALQAAVRAGLIGGDAPQRYAGVIAIGCVIRGETSHYDIVCNNTNHWLMETVIRHNIPFGNAVLTVDTEAQAMSRAEGGASGKGGDAARACLRMIWLKQKFVDHQVAFAP
jgi:6,7-dimethyl-8-ribityllumazine synthase